MAAWDLDSAYLEAKFTKMEHMFYMEQIYYNLWYNVYNFWFTKVAENLIGIHSHLRLSLLFLYCYVKVYLVMIYISPLYTRRFCILYKSSSFGSTCLRIIKQTTVAYKIYLWNLGTRWKILLMSLFRDRLHCYWSGCLDRPVDPTVWCYDRSTTSVVDALGSLLW